jgi:hypothetical protein
VTNTDGTTSYTYSDKKGNIYTSGADGSNIAAANIKINPADPSNLGNLAATSTSIFGKGVAIATNPLGAVQNLKGSKPTIVVQGSGSH